MAAFRNLILATAVPALLAGCTGEGYEMVPYHGEPYTLEGTAGSGVAYVRASMLPAKGPVVEEAAAPAEEAAPAPAEEEISHPVEDTAHEAPVSDGEDLFNKEVGSGVK